MHTKQVVPPQHTSYSTIPEGSLYSQLPTPTTSNICLISVAASHLFLLQSFTEKDTESGLVPFTQHAWHPPSHREGHQTSYFFSHLWLSPCLDTGRMKKRQWTFTYRLVDTCVHPERMLRNMPSACCTPRWFLRNCRHPRHPLHKVQGTFSFFKPSLHVNLSYRERLPDTGLAYSPYILTFTSLFCEWPV